MMFLGGKADIAMRHAAAHGMILRQRDEMICKLQGNLIAIETLRIREVTIDA
jgi:hypothetical protein